MKKRPALPRTQDSHPVGAPFMTPGTGAERQTPTRHDGAHAAQQRTHAGDMNVAPTLPAVPTRTDEKTTGHHDRTVAYPVGAPFMTPGTEAVRQTPTRHNGAHAAQQRTHAGDINVAPTLTAVSTCTNEKTTGHHDRTATYPVGAPFMTPGTEAERQTPTRHDGTHAGETDATDRTCRTHTQRNGARTRAT